MKDPHNIILRPHITERTAAMSYGDPLIKDEREIVRKYTFIVAPDANKIEIKKALEEIYNAGKKKGETITVTQVRTVTVHGKLKRVRTRAKAFPSQGHEVTQKKAIITLAKGQMLEDYGV